MNLGEKVKNVFSGFILGVVLFFASFLILWNNEASYVENLRKADFIQKNVISITNYNPANNLKLVHYTGSVTTNDNVSDDFVTINTPVIERKVEMYQWDESCSTSGSGSSKRRSCNYTKEWEDREINSDYFEQGGHRNPRMTIKSDTFYAENVSLGEFKLDKTLIEDLSANSSFSNLPNKSGYQIVSGFYFSGTNYSNPEIGDYRISYKYLPVNSPVSVISSQYNKMLYEFKNKKYTVGLLYNGIHTAKEMVKMFKDDAKMLVFLLRFVGFIFMAIGISLILSPLSKIFSFIPVIGEIAERLTIFAATIIALALTLITIAIAWIAVRPLISIPLIIISAVLIILVFKKNRK